MDNNLSYGIQSIEISGIRKFYNKVSKVEDAISLTLGQPDFNVPQKIKDSIIKAVLENKTEYTSNAGLPELRKHISLYLKKLDIYYDMEEICITVGGSEGLMSVFTALLNAEDKVLIPTPAYPAYESCVKILGGTVINYNLNEDFSINIENIETLIKKHNPKVLILSYPSNPTGAVLSREERDRLESIISKYNITIITDEMYAPICFEDKFYSIAQKNSIRNKIILVGGFSKMFSMTGLRIGYVCASSYYLNQIIKAHQYSVSCAPSIVQYGAIEGLKSCLEEVECMKNTFIKRRDYVYNRLLHMGLDVNLPKGAFYIFPSIKRYGIKSEEFCERLLYQNKVAVVPGNAFGIGGEGYVRISYSYSLERLEEALNRIENFVKKLW